MKKNRIVAKTHCVNIGNKCPAPKCDDPVLLPERCCKTCPGGKKLFGKKTKISPFFCYKHYLKIKISFSNRIKQY